MAAVPTALAWAGAFLALVGYACLFRETYIDDAYITLQYARTLADSLTWGFHPGHAANTATSPLNVVALALFGLPFQPTVGAVAWLTGAELAAMLWVLPRISRRVTGTAHFGVIAFAGLVANPLLVSAIGLEGHLYALLMLVAVALFCEARWIPSGSPSACSH